MSDIFGISVSALQAFQNAISVTSNNVANASTPGYDRESINLAAGPPQSNGTALIGSGVVVNGVSRAYSQTTFNQLNASQSSLGQINALQGYANQINNIFGTTAGGVSTALQGFYNAWSTVAANPTSTGARQALLGQAQTLATSFQSTSGQIASLNSSINTQITLDVQQINSIATSISQLNSQIAVGTAQAGGQPPNELLDQRDQLITNLSKLVGVSTTTNTNNTVDVFIGNGQPLVLQGQTTQLTTIPSAFDPSQLDISTSASNGNSISGNLTSGDLGGLLAARSQVIDPAQNQLGQIALAVAQTVNSQQGKGLDLNGQLGAALFSVSGPQASASTRNTSAVTASVGVANLGQLTTDNYVLAYRAGAYTLTDATTGANVALTGAGTAASPLQAAGLSIVLSGTPASGDQFLIQPTGAAAGSFAVALGDPTQIAAASAIQTSAGSANTGSATISAGTVLDGTNPNLLATTTIQFTSPTTYSVNGAGSYAYTSGSNITLNGWQVAISGTPATGDSFTVASNVGGSGDNRNALAVAGQQNAGVLDNGQVSVNAAVSDAITAIGSQTQQLTTAQTAQTAVNTQAQNAMQSVSGVNLNEEAASLLQWQQAYDAAAKALQIGSSLFQTLLTAVRSA